MRSPGQLRQGAHRLFPTDPTIRRIAEREHNVVHWTEFTRGGHFAAVEAPDLLIADIRKFFRRQRGRNHM